MVATTRAQQPEIPTSRRIRTLTHRLRDVYHDTYWPAHNDAARFGSQYELPDGSRLDPTYTADAAACRAVNASLVQTMEAHLPGAVLVERIDEAPTVIDSVWSYVTDDGEELEVTIEWDYRYSFGDPDGLSVRARKAVAR